MQSDAAACCVADSSKWKSVASSSSCGRTWSSGKLWIGRAWVGGICTKKRWTETGNEDCGCGQHAHIDRRGEGLATGNAKGGQTQAVEGTTCSVKDRTKEALSELHQDLDTGRNIMHFYFILPVKTEWVKRGAYILHGFMPCTIIYNGMAFICNAWWDLESFQSKKKKRPWDGETGRPRYMCTNP